MSRIPSTQEAPVYWYRTSSYMYGHLWTFWGHRLNVATAKRVLSSSLHPCPYLLLPQLPVSMKTPPEMVITDLLFSQVLFVSLPKSLLHLSTSLHLPSHHNRNEATINACPDCCQGTPPRRPCFPFWPLQSILHTAARELLKMPL